MASSADALEVVVLVDSGLLDEEEGVGSPGLGSRFIGIAKDHRDKIPKTQICKRKNNVNRSIEVQVKSDEPYEDLTDSSDLTDVHLIVVRNAPEIEAMQKNDSFQNWCESNLNRSSGIIASSTLIILGYAPRTFKGQKKYNFEFGLISAQVKWDFQAFLVDDTMGVELDKAANFIYCFIRSFDKLKGDKETQSNSEGLWGLKEGTGGPKSVRVDLATLCGLKRLWKQQLEVICPPHGKRKLTGLSNDELDSPYVMYENVMRGQSGDLTNVDALNDILDRMFKSDDGNLVPRNVH